MYLISNNYLVGRSVEPSRKKDLTERRGQGGRGAGGWVKGRRTETREDGREGRGG